MATARPTPDRYLQLIAADAAEIGRVGRRHPDTPVPTCPGWTGADLLVHLVGYARWLTGLIEGTRTIDTEVPVVDRDEALTGFDDELTHLRAVLAAADPAAAVPNWSVLPGEAAFWIRRTAHDVAVHRVDAQLTASGVDEPIPADLAVDGVAEYVEAFVATAFAMGAAPEADATLQLELTDTGTVVAADLPRPGPVTVLRGPASEVLLALWHRRDPLDFFVRGDRDRIANWPRI